MFGWNIGAIIDFSENHHLLLSAGRDIRGPDRLHAYIGYQLTFGFGDPGSKDEALQAGSIR